MKLSASDRTSTGKMEFLLFILLLTLFNCVISDSESCVERDRCDGIVIDQRDMINSEAIKNRNCFCDQACFRYDDCCEDIKFLHNNYKWQQSMEYTCVDYMYPFRIRSQSYIPTVIPIWMVTNCLSNYQYTQLAIKCMNYPHQKTFLTYPPAYIPMTSRRTNLTYRNIYCAQCNNEKTNDLIDWSFQLICSGFNLNNTYKYHDEMNLTQLSFFEHAERCTNRLEYPSSPAVIHPCKQVTINSCPDSFTENITTIHQCATINAYRYVIRPHPSLFREYSLYRNEYCLACHNVSKTLHISCEHQLDDELKIDPKPKTGFHLGRLSILFNPDALELRSPFLSYQNLSLSHYQHQAHLTTIYPCRQFEVYDYSLHLCVLLQDVNDWRLLISFNCSKPVRIRREDALQWFDDKNNDSLSFSSNILSRQHGDFVILFSDSNKVIICDERLSLTYLQYNSLITIVRYTCTIVSLIALLIFIISFSRKSSLHNLSGKCLLMLSFSLFGSQSLFLASGHLVTHPNHFWCIVSGIAVHLFYLSSFAWLVTISFDTYFNLTRTTRLDRRTGHHRFILYSIFVWAFSISIVSISMVLYLILPEKNPWSPSYGRILCSISSRQALIAFFLAPVACFLLINLALFVKAVIHICRVDRDTQIARRRREHERSRLLLYIRLAILMGLHWSLLVICLLLNNSILWLLFDIVNSLPGIYIVLGFLHDQHFISECQRKLRSSQTVTLPSLSTSTMNNELRHLRQDDSFAMQMSQAIDNRITGRT